MITLQFYKYELEEYERDLLEPTKPVMCLPYYSHSEVAKDLEIVKEKIRSFLSKYYGYVVVQPINFKIDNKKQMFQLYLKHGIYAVFCEHLHYSELV